VCALWRISLSAGQALPSAVNSPCLSAYWLKDGGKSLPLSASVATPPLAAPGGKAALLLQLRSRPLRPRTAEAAVRGEAGIGTRLLLSDSKVNILEFLLGPGEECAFHRHRLPYLFTNFSNSFTQSLAE
ncbi:unnamed protein product, partial [Polarella glacialis]